MTAAPVSEFINKTSGKGMFPNTRSSGLKSTSSYDFCNAAAGSGDGACRSTTVQKYQNIRFGMLEQRLKARPLHGR